MRRRESLGMRSSSNGDCQAVGGPSNCRSLSRNSMKSFGNGEQLEGQLCVAGLGVLVRNYSRRFI